jgi:hypothetical protein
MNSAGVQSLTRPDLKRLVGTPFGDRRECPQTTLLSRLGWDRVMTAMGQVLPYTHRGRIGGLAPIPDLRTLGPERRGLTEKRQSAHIGGEHRSEAAGTCHVSGSPARRNAFASAAIFSGFT